MTAHATSARRITAQAAKARPPAGRSATTRVRPAPRGADFNEPLALRVPVAGRGAARAGMQARAPDWPPRVALAFVFLAAVAMLSLPQARAASDTFGWLPLWLPGLPVVAWLALACARGRTG